MALKEYDLRKQNKAYLINLAAELGVAGLSEEQTREQIIQTLMASEHAAPAPIISPAPVAGVGQRLAEAVGGQLIHEDKDSVTVLVNGRRLCTNINRPFAQALHGLRAFNIASGDAGKSLEA